MKSTDFLNMPTDSIRTALERLISAYDEHGGRWPQHHEDALHDAVERARADLAAEPLDPAGGGEALLAAAPLEGEEPTTEELNRLYREIYGLHSDVLGSMPRKFARAVLARWGRPAAPAARPKGEVAELVAWLNVEADLRRNDLSTPTGLNLAQAARQADKLQSWAALLEQQAAAAPAPAAEGEVAELVAWLRSEAEINDSYELTKSAAFERRAATLLQQQAAELAALRAPQGGEVE